MHHAQAATEKPMRRGGGADACCNVYLVGPMGSGKTTLGRRVAARLGLEFVDCDQEIERQTGVSVSLIFDIEGEEGFRARETALLQVLAKRTGLLVATGGGVVIRRINRELMQGSGFIVWLRTPLSHQIDRLSRDRTRPLLQTPDREQRLRQLAEQRNHLYQEIANLVFDSSHRNITRGANHLAEAIRRQYDPSRGDGS